MSVLLIILVTNLHDTTSDKLKDMFDGAVSAEVPMRYVKNAFRQLPYGFVTFNDEYHLNLALARIPPLVNGQQVKIERAVMWSEIEDTLKVTTLPSGITAGQIKAFFKEYEPAAVKMMKDYALVKFETKVDRDAAVIELNGKPWRGINVQIEWSNETL